MRRSLRSLLAATLGGAVLLTAAIPALPAAALAPTACRVRIAGGSTVYRTLPDALNAAPLGAQLTLRGVCDGPAFIDQEISITGIRPRRAARPAIRGTGSGSVIRTNGAPVVRLENLRITGGTGTGDYGGGIYNDGEMTLIDVVVTGNGAPVGGGIINTAGGTLILGGTTAIFRNTGGGGVWNEGVLRMTGRSVIRDHTKTGQGAGVYNTTSAVLRMFGASRITGNSASGEGGGVYATISSTISLTDRAQIAGNSGSAGGGVRLLGANLTIAGAAVILGNTATTSSGGGILASDATTVAMFADARISGNKALAGDGGGIISGGTVTLAGSASITGNGARSGGGVAIVGAGTIAMSGLSVIRTNSATTLAGGLYAAAEGATTGVVCGTNVRQNSAPLFADCYLFQPG